MYIGIFAGMFTFFACVVGFSVGFRFGKAIADGKEPTVEVIDKIADFVQPKKDEKESDDSWDAGFRNLMSYDGDPKTK